MSLTKTLPACLARHHDDQSAGLQLTWIHITNKSQKHQVTADTQDKTPRLGRRTER